MALAFALAFAACIDWSHEYWSVALPQISGLVLMAAFCVQLLVTRTPAVMPRIFWLVVLLVTWGAAQLAFGITVSRYTTAQSTLVWASSAAYLWFGANVLRHDRARELFLTIVLVFGVVLAVLAVLQFYTARDLTFWFIPGHEPIGPFIYKNHFAAFIELIFPIAVVRIQLDPRRVWLWSVVAAALFGAVVVSASRGGVLMLSLELISILIIGAARGWISVRRAGLLSIQIPVLLIIAVSIFGWESIWEHFHETGSTSVRKQLLVSTGEMIATRPVQGYGLGTWPMVYPRFAHFDSALFANEAHDDWAQWAAEGGIPFALFVAALAGWTFWRGVRCPWALGPSAIFVHSLFDYPLRDPAVIALHFALIGALATGCTVHVKRRRSLSRS